MNYFLANDWEDEFLFVFSSRDFSFDANIATKLLTELQHSCYDDANQKGNESPPEESKPPFEIIGAKNVAGWTIGQLRIKSAFFQRIFLLNNLDTAPLTEPKGKPYYSTDEESARFVSWFNTRLKERGSDSEIKTDPARADYSRGAGYVQYGILSRLLETVHGRQRPGWVTLLGLFILLAGGFSIAAVGFLLLFIISDWTNITTTPDVIAIVYFSLLGLIGPAWGIGILRGKNWAWWLTICLSLGSIVVSAMALINGNVFGLIGVAFGGVIASLFTRRQVKIFFGIRY